MRGGYVRVVPRGFASSLIHGSTCLAMLGRLPYSIGSDLQSTCKERDTRR